MHGASHGHRRCLAASQGFPASLVTLLTILLGTLFLSTASGAKSAPPTEPVPHCDSGTVAPAVDRFTGESTLKTTNNTEKWASSQPAPPMFSLLATWGKDKTPTDVLLSFYAAGPPIRDCNRLNFLLDGKPFAPRSFKDFTKLTGLPAVRAIHLDSLGVTIVSASMTIAELGKLLSASKIEYQICTGEYELSVEDVCNSRAFYWTLAASK
jgi:hypothetical protein